MQKSRTSCLAILCALSDLVSQAISQIGSAGRQTNVVTHNLQQIHLKPIAEANVINNILPNCLEHSFQCYIVPVKNRKACTSATSCQAGFETPKQGHLLYPLLCKCCAPNGVPTVQLLCIYCCCAGPGERWNSIRKGAHSTGSCGEPSALWHPHWLSYGWHGHICTRRRGPDTQGMGFNTA